MIASVHDPEVDERRRIEDREAAEDWASIDRLRERNKDEDPDEVMAVMTEVVEEVRREMYAEEQRSAARRR
jgi:hypothetical protein